MNRQQRRAQQQRLDPVAGLRANVAAAPNDARARNALACALHAQGKPAEASEQFARGLMLAPELFQQYPQIVATLLQLNPPLRTAICIASSGYSSSRRSPMIPQTIPWTRLARGPVSRGLADSGVLAATIPASRPPARAATLTEA